MLALNSFLNDPLVIFLCGLALLILFIWYFATDVERRKRNVGSVLTIGVAALSVLAFSPPKEKLKGGIDIVGGSSFSLKIQEKETEDGTKMPVTKEQIEQAKTIITKRLDSMGGKEALIASQGEDGVLVQMPGATPEEGEEIRATLEKVAKLELREVHPQNEMLAARVAAGEEIVPGYRAYKHNYKDADGNEMSTDILLNRRMALGGSDIANAVPSVQQADAVDITLNGDGEDKMIALTKNMQAQRDRIAIVLDGEVISAPVVNQTPLGKRFIIEGLSEPGEVQNLANALMNPLENPMQIAEMRSVSPTLGAAVVQQALVAGALSLAFTFLFMLLYYRFSGLIAIAGLLVNGVMLFGVMAMFGFTFSLPGIAGMILTIGMAVDANVLIFERLREEIAAGKSVRNAIDAAYEKAFSAIFDSNVTSLITAVILIAFGTGAVKGFAITLTIGLVSSMFAAILVTRVLFRWGTDLKWIQKLSFMNLIKATNYNFMAKRRPAFLFAGALFLVAVGALAWKRENALGVDFTGGTIITMQLPEDSGVALDTINGALAGLTLTKEAYPQIQSSPATPGATLTIRCANEDAESITGKLRENVPAIGKKSDDGSWAVDASMEEVSPIIGGSYLTQSLIAITLGIIGIVIYLTVRFEFAFALGGFVAVFHDVIICVGLIVLFGDQLTMIHVGAILTIAGYSINDTIIVFDRIRETILIRTGSVASIMNEAINATLSRTLLTSTTTIASVLLLWGLCGSALSSFGLIIFIGIAVGTFSSIFIAAPVVLWWSGRNKDRDLRSDVLATKEAAEAAAAAP